MHKLLVDICNFRMFADVTIKNIQHLHLLRMQGRRWEVVLMCGDEADPFDTWSNRFLSS